MLDASVLRLFGAPPHGKGPPAFITVIEVLRHFTIFIIDLLCLQGGGPREVQPKGSPACILLSCSG